MIRLTTDSDSLFWRFVVELFSYTFFLVPALVLFIVESDVSLKFWHAVNQLPHHEQEITQTDSESNVDDTHQAEVSAMRKAVKRLARREMIGKFCIGFILFSIAACEQYVAYSGMLDYSLPENSEGDHTSDNFDPLADDGYSRYSHSTFGHINWTKSYYAIVLFWPAVFLTARAVYMLSGLKERVVLRHTTGMPFVVPIISRGAASLCTTRVAIFVILLSTFITAGALYSNVCSAGVYASLIHFNIANITSAKSMSSKDIIGRGFIIISFMVPEIWRVISEGSPEPIDISYLPKQHGSFGWASLIMSALVCDRTFNIMAFFYRVDHAFARPEELLVGAPDVAIAVDQEVEVLGARLSYAHSHYTTAEPRSSFNKPYFRAAVWGWLAAYAIIAALSVSDYIACCAESAGVFAMFIAPPIMVVGVLLCALVKGEVKKLWVYKEDWMYDPDDMQLVPGRGPGILLCEEKGVKILIPEKG